MNTSIQPLQEATVHLLDALYRDKHLDMTTAMLTIQNGRYPSIEAILTTLQRYENDELVSSFTKSNSLLIDEAKKYVKEKKAEEQEPADDYFGSTLEFVSPFKLMKTVSLFELEESFSSALSQLCGEELTVTVEGLNKKDSMWRESVDVKLSVAAKDGSR